MKNTLLFTLLLTAIGFASIAQPVPGSVSPVITEIMFNPPESGNDSLEFVEISNPSLTAVINMGGYYINDAFSFTFPSGFVLTEGASVVISGDSVMFESTFGVQTFEWSGSTTQLNNSGESITLKNSANAVMDSVRYGTTASWPQEADGGGASLVLCDPTSDNSLAANWSASEHATGVIINSVEIYADPGVLSTCTSTGIADDNIITTVVYPNPSEGVFNLKFEPLADAGTLRIHNSLGQLVYSKAVAVGSSMLTISEDLKSGYYIVSLNHGDAVERLKLSIR